MNDHLQETATDAVRRACRFLEENQDGDGFWRDYELPPGASSEWVTAFVGYALAGTRLSRSEPTGRALSAMRSSCRPTGWGYNAAVATDADTTSWAVRWFARTNTPLPIEPVSCLEAYVGPEGGARTFACGPRYGSWTIEHADVTGVLGMALKEAGAAASTIERVRGWTLGRRNNDGLWSSFWWTFDAYAGARMLELLDGTGGVPAEVAEAARRGLETAAEPLTPMETANLLMMALRVGVRPDAWASSLLGRQRADGGWPPSRVLRVPDQKCPTGDGAAFEDGNSLMSTAMSVMALTELLGDGHAA